MGRLLFDRPATNCDMIPVALEVVDVQPVAITYTDSTCGFRFSRVPPGSYSIHVNIDGYAEVRADVTVDVRFGAGGLLNVPMTASASRVANGVKGGSSAKPSVDVSEIVDQYPKKAVSLYNKAQGNRKKGRNAAAIHQLESAIKIAPNFYQAHNSLGVLYTEAGKFAEAEDEFRRAHEINRTSAEPLVNLGSLYLHEDEPELAAKTSQEAVQKNSKSAPALFNLGVSLYRIAQLDRAENALLKALEIAPRMFQVRLALVNVYLKLHRFGDGDGSNQCLSL